MIDGTGKENRSFTLEITPAGQIPQAKLRAKVKEAIDEASAKFKQEHPVALEISGTPEGGLFDLGVAWPWVIHFGGAVLGELLYKASEEAAKEAGKEFGKGVGHSFYELLKESLRKRNLTVSKPYDLRLFPDPNHPYASLPPAPPVRDSAKKRSRKGVVKKKSGTKSRTKKKGKRATKPKRR